MKKILLILLICLATIISGAPNPFIEVDTMDKAFEMTGFTLKTPVTCKNYKKKKINVIKDKMIEVVYLKETNTEGLVIRKSKGTYNIDKDVKTIRIGNYDVIPSLSVQKLKYKCKVPLIQNFTLLFYLFFLLCTNLYHNNLILLILLFLFSILFLVIYLTLSFLHFLVIYNIHLLSWLLLRYS